MIQLAIVSVDAIAHSPDGSTLGLAMGTDRGDVLQVVMSPSTAISVAGAIEQAMTNLVVESGRETAPELAVSYSFTPGNGYVAVRVVTQQDDVEFTMFGEAFRRFATDAFQAAQAVPGAEN